MSDEVSNFLRSVEQLKDRRFEEDEARSRELEEKILQEKRERQARRAERARSISPQKSSPANTPPPPSHRHNNSQLSDGLNLASSPAVETTGSPQFRSHRQTDTMGSADFSTSPTKENDSPFDLDNKRSSVTSPAGALPSRTPTLSWQRRPTSQASERPKSRPLSMLAAENAAARSSATAPDPTESLASRDQISQALSSKDPAWFRQTADRGQNSAAYRKAQVEDEDRLDMTSGRTQLPGMSRAAPADMETESASTQARFGSPMSLSQAQRLDPPNGDSESLAHPPSPGRTSPTRPISPTKGLGGFVQSAMMKRTDSVKRWSVTSPPGLQRADSVASGRTSLDRSTQPPGANSRPSSRSRESLSRPTSSHDRDASQLMLDTSDKKLVEEPKRVADEKTTPPASPSKTMDPRRWSPTKSSSWLEAALNKPESPKPKPTPPPSNQPAWMVELNKAKAQKSTHPSADLDRAPSTARRHEVKTGGLMRSSPMGSNVKPSGLGGVGAYHSPSSSISGDRTTTAGIRSNLSKSASLPGPGEGPSPSYSRGGSPSANARPDTPPKKVFSAAASPAPAPAAGGPDFKNVFGNLRKTQTKNYVAPDTFTDNIKRGKAALAITGGPKPREKNDELKDAILQKKAEFKQAKAEGLGITTNAYKSTDKPIPEGLAKRMEMTRSNTTSSKRDSTASDTPSEAPSRTLDSNRGSTMSTISKRESVESVPTPGEKEAPGSPLHKEKSAPGRLQKPGGSALADRFNPMLAGMLARGPPSMASGPGKEAGRAPTQEPSGPGPQLTHMTKGRARGPKRKAPSAAAKSVEEPQKTRPQAASPDHTEKSSALPEPRLEPQVVSLVDSSTKRGHESKSSVGGVISLVDSSKKRSIDETPKFDGSVISLVDSSRPAARPRSPTKIHEQVAAIAARGQKVESKQPEESVSQPSSPRKLDVKRMSQFLDDSNQGPASQEAPRPLSPAKTGGSRSPEARQLSPQRTGGRALPASPKREVWTEKIDSEPAAPARNGVTLLGGFSSGATSKPFAGAPILQPQRPRSPTKSSGPISPPLGSPLRSPTRYAVEVAAMFGDFFGNERPEREYHADAGEILTRRPNTPPKVKTQNVQLFRVSGDGKKQRVPTHQERVLFEREMYLCPHTFTNELGKKVSEVYFWAGDEVPEATIEDAQVFLNREARSLGGKLVHLRQGKETSEFLQALGGIIIVRRGSSNKYDSLAPNLLCGRRYLGQIAFDEVDFSPKSLCSGFPYLITQQGKCYLWKGKGSDVDELSCARLIGMDLALMGELAEVDDGLEAAEFWDIFDGGSKSGSADHWRLKPNYDKYRSRLFRSDAAHPKQILEIHPFNQSDLSPSNVYILDAFFEMYIIVGYGAQSQYVAFHNALDFAQEYAILASGMEDRPFVPISTVVLEGIPRDLKSVFRKWRDTDSPTRMNSNNPTSPNLKRGRSLRIVPLTQALQALTE